jgi:hypothetical protein
MIPKKTWFPKGAPALGRSPALSEKDPKCGALAKNLRHGSLTEAFSNGI